MTPIKWIRCCRSSKAFIIKVGRRYWWQFMSESLVALFDRKDSDIKCTRMSEDLLGSANLHDFELRPPSSQNLVVSALSLQNYHPWHYFTVRWLYILLQSCCSNRCNAWTRMAYRICFAPLRQCLLWCPRLLRRQQRAVLLVFRYTDTREQSRRTILTGFRATVRR